MGSGPARARDSGGGGGLARHKKGRGWQKNLAIIGVLVDVPPELVEKGGDAVEVTLTGATDFSAPFGNGVIAIGDLVWLEDGEGPVVNLGVGGLLPAHEPNYANFYSNNGNPDYFNVVATNFSSFISTWQDFMDYGAGGANTLEIRELKLNHAPLIDDSFGWTVYAIPEPSTFALLALGVLA